jgi:outer membrane protein TolC
VLELRRRQIEAQRAIAEARGNNGLRIGLNASLGFTQTGSNLSDVYSNTLDQEVVGLSLGVPIADWGKTRARRSIAESNQQLETVNIRQEEITFEREVLIKAQQFSLLRDQVALAARSLEVAQKRQEMTRNRYYIGKIGITELNIAVSEQDAARRAYAGALQNYWLAYYELRLLTLYDFEREEPLLRDAEKF